MSIGSRNRQRKTSSSVQLLLHRLRALFVLALVLAVPANIIDATASLSVDIANDTTGEPQQVVDVQNLPPATTIAPIESAPTQSSQSSLHISSETEEVVYQTSQLSL